MRRCRTDAENALWQRLRREQLGVRFRSQVAIGRFIVDFYCPARRVVVEVDGSVHESQSDADRERDVMLTGLCVLRVENNDVLGDLDAVIRVIASALERR
jgi:very-short-patch-repair endonuclease